jgi:outer membrane protein
MPGLGPSTRPSRSTRVAAFAAGVAVWSFAVAEDLVQVYQDAVRYDAVYAAARHTLAAGRERLPQGRALLLPSLNL